MGGMPDPTAAQNLCDALKAWAGSAPAERGPYAFFKEYQTIVAAAVAVCGGVGTATVAYIAAKLAYKSNTEKLEAEQQAAVVRQNGRKLGFYLRLRSQLKRFEVDISSKADRLKIALDMMKQKEPEPLSKIKNIDTPTRQEISAFIDAVNRREIKWEPTFDVVAELDELEIAWKVIDLFPKPAIRLIDNLRLELNHLKEFSDREIAVLKKTDGNVGDTTAESYYSFVDSAVNTAKELIEVLDRVIIALEKGN
jgi:hypothetical protein